MFVKGSIVASVFVNNDFPTNEFCTNFCKNEFCENEKNVFVKHLDFYETSNSILASLTNDERMKHLLQTRKTKPNQHKRLVFFPKIWSGIFNQFKIDLPRCKFHYKQKEWDDANSLLKILNWDFGPIWSKWICAFANQAPLFDVVQAVYDLAVEKYDCSNKICNVMEINNMFVTFGQGSNLKKTATYVLDTNNMGMFELKIFKNLMVVIMNEKEIDQTLLVQTEYKVAFNKQSIEIAIKFVLT